MTEEAPPPLEQLAQDIKQARDSIVDKSKPNAKIKGYSTATKIATDLVCGVVVGVFIGYLLDDFLGTKPLFIIICMLLGTAAGVKLMIEHSKQKS